MGNILLDLEIEDWICV